MAIEKPKLSGKTSQLKYPQTDSLLSRTTKSSINSKQICLTQIDNSGEYEPLEITDEQMAPYTLKTFSHYITTLMPPVEPKQIIVLEQEYIQEFVLDPLTLVFDTESNYDIMNQQVNFGQVEQAKPLFFSSFAQLPLEREILIPQANIPMECPLFVEFRDEAIVSQMVDLLQIEERQTVPIHESELLSLEPLHVIRYVDLDGNEIYVDRLNLVDETQPDFVQLYHQNISSLDPLTGVQTVVLSQTLPAETLSVEEIQLLQFDPRHSSELAAEEYKSNDIVLQKEMAIEKPKLSGKTSQLKYPQTDSLLSRTTKSSINSKQICLTQIDNSGEYEPLEITDEQMAPYTLKTFSHYITTLMPPVEPKQIIVLEQEYIQEFVLDPLTLVFDTESNYDIMNQQVNFGQVEQAKPLFFSSFAQLPLEREILIPQANIPMECPLFVEFRDEAIVSQMVDLLQIEERQTVPIHESELLSLEPLHVIRYVDLDGNEIYVDRLNLVDETQPDFVQLYHQNISSLDPLTGVQTVVLSQTLSAETLSVEEIQLLQFDPRHSSELAAEEYKSNDIVLQKEMAIEKPKLSGKTSQLKYPQTDSLLSRTTKSSINSKQICLTQIDNSGEYEPLEITDEQMAPYTLKTFSHYITTLMPPVEPKQIIVLEQEYIQEFVLDPLTLVFDTESNYDIMNQQVNFGQVEQAKPLFFSSFAQLPLEREILIPQANIPMECPLFVEFRDEAIVSQMVDLLQIEERQTVPIHESELLSLEPLHVIRYVDLDGNEIYVDRLNLVDETQPDFVQLYHQNISSLDPLTGVQTVVLSQTLSAETLSVEEIQLLQFDPRHSSELAAEEYKSNDIVLQKEMAIEKPKLSGKTSQLKYPQTDSLLSRTTKSSINSKQICLTQIDNSGEYEPLEITDEQMAPYTLKTFSHYITTLMPPVEPKQIIVLEQEYIQEFVLDPLTLVFDTESNYDIMNQQVNFGQVEQAKPLFFSSFAQLPLEREILIPQANIPMECPLFVEFRDEAIVSQMVDLLQIEERQTVPIHESELLSLEPLHVIRYVDLDGNEIYVDRLNLVDETQPDFVQLYHQNISSLDPLTGVQTVVLSQTLPAETLSVEEIQLLQFDPRHSSELAAEEYKSNDIVLQKEMAIEKPKLSGKTSQLKYPQTDSLLSRTTKSSVKLQLPSYQNQLNQKVEIEPIVKFVVQPKPQHSLLNSLLSKSNYEPVQQKQVSILNVDALKKTIKDNAEQNPMIQTINSEQQTIESLLNQVQDQFPENSLKDLALHLHNMFNRSVESFIFGDENVNFELFQNYANILRGLYHENKQMKLVSVYLKFLKRIKKGTYPNSILDAYYMVYGK
ncbi:Hypothetical_protein [Hexamita inflata]|uniref:Hypothetical_protein n=1 Tax=Hexamita inflata TaxID=28002 RepID=A0ABP1HBJ5_9EUKA